MRIRQHFLCRGKRRNLRKDNRRILEDGMDEYVIQQAIEVIYVSPKVVPSIQKVIKLLPIVKE